MKTIFKTLTAILFATAIGCAGGTGTGNPVTVELSFASYTGFSKVTSFTVSDIKMCFKRLRFKTDGESTETDTSTDADNIDFEIGEVTIDASGTTLAEITVPEGTYSRVEFDLEKDCTSGNSLQVTNSSGTFQTDSRITIKFEGEFTVSSTAPQLELYIQNIVSALDGVTADNEIKDAAESVSGN